MGRPLEAGKKGLGAVKHGSESVGRTNGQVAVSMNGIELQDREFFAAIREGREPNSSVAQVLACYEVLQGLERQLAGA